MKKNKLKISVLVNVIVILAMIVSLLFIVDEIYAFDSTKDFIYYSLFGIGLLMLAISFSFFVILDRLLTNKGMLVAGLLKLIFNLFGLIIYGFVAVSVGNNGVEYIIILLSLASLIINSIFYYQKYEELTNY